MYPLVTLAQLSGPDAGVSFSEIVSNLPLDPASVFVYALVAFSAFLVWKGSRAGKGKMGGGV